MTKGVSSVDSVTNNKVLGQLCVRRLGLAASIATLDHGGSEDEGNETKKSDRGHNNFRDSSLSGFWNRVRDLLHNTKNKPDCNHKKTGKG